MIETRELWYGGHYFKMPDDFHTRASSYACICCHEKTIKNGRAIMGRGWPEFVLEGRNPNEYGL